MIPKQNYFSRDVFEKEMEVLFSRGYQFAALTTELSEDRDFVCVDYFSTSIVVQNFKGAIKAFQNVCAHRFNRIQTEERGNRALTCMYHGWTYDADGAPAGLPKRAQFMSRCSNVEDLRLTRYKVEICGIFVFVAPETSQVDLRDQLGTFYDTLAELGSHFGRETHYGNIPHKANWKLIVENVVECYHCSTVHQDTFIRFGYGRAEMQDLVIDGANSGCHWPREDAVNEDVLRRGLAHLNGRSLQHRSYHHVFLFPNMFVSSTQGTSFFVGQLLPVSEEETILRLRYFEPKIELKSWHRTMQDAISADTVNIGLQLVAEDKQILENIQRGMRLSDRPGILGDDEVRIAAFAEQYKALMADAAGAERPAESRENIIPQQAANA